MYLYLKYLLSGLLILYASCSQSQDWSPPAKGILDLRNYEFNAHSYVKLNGEWEFYWQTFVSPEELRSANPPVPTLYGRVPAYWIDYNKEGFSFPGTGFASYRLRILLPEGFTEYLGFDIPVFDAAMTLMLDGEEILRNGQPGTSEESSTAEYLPLTAVYKPASDTLEILLHVSNFQHRRGGFWKSMQIGYPSMIIKTKQKYRLVSFISLGILLAFALFFFFFYLFYRKDKIPLTFSLILTGVFIRMMNTDLYPVNYVLDISWDWTVKLEYLGTFLALGAAIWYFFQLFPTRYMLWITRINTILIILSGFVIIFFKVRIFAYTMLYFQPAVLLFITYYIIACVWSIFKGNRKNIFLLAGLILFIAALVNDILVANSISALSKTYTVHFALQVFIFIQAILIIRTWISAFMEREKLVREIEYINRNLETLVDERTLELNKRTREIQQKNEYIEARNRELKDALDFKNRVFTIIAHDLKSPVANLVQNSILLNYSLGGPERDRLIGSFAELSNSALNLIDNLLYWGRSQGDQLNYKPEKLDIKLVVKDVLKLIGEMARQKSISLEQDFEGDTIVFADRELLDIVCRNLLSNAIKFTGQGGKIRINSSKAANSGKLTLRFRDNGIGIPQKRLKALLDTSSELISTVGTAKEKGTGLGLRLCYELVHVNKGELSIESKEGVGTTVSVSIPLA